MEEYQEELEKDLAISEANYADLSRATKEQPIAIDDRVREELDPQPTEPSIDAVMLWHDEVAKSAMGGLVANAIWLKELSETRGAKEIIESISKAAYKTAEGMWERRKQTRAAVAQQMQQDKKFQDLGD